MAAHLPVPSNGDLKPGFSPREKLSYFSEVPPHVYFPSFFLFFKLFLFGDQSLPVPELHRLEDPAGGRDLRVPNPQRRVRFKGTVI